MNPQWRIFRLNEGETIASFDCGDEDLHDFIHNEAKLYRKALLAMSYGVLDETQSKVVGYFSLANDRISLGDFVTKTEFNRFRKYHG